jgi:hypothetical protein
MHRSTLGFFGRIAVLACLLGAWVQGASVQGYFSTSTYTFSRRSLEDSTQLHFRLYQSALVRANDLLFKKSRLSFSGIFYTDPVNSFDNEPVFQVYQFSYLTQWFQSRLMVTVGRQFVYSTGGSGRMDGLLLQHNLKTLRLKGFVGGYVPASGITSEPFKNRFLGLELRWRPSQTLDLRLGYLDKAHGRTEYRSEYVRNTAVPATIQRRLGFQGRWQGRSWSLFLRNRYKVVPFQTADLTVQLARQVRRSSRLQNVVVEYTFREPQVPDNSIFSVFNASPHQELRVQTQVRLTGQLITFGEVRQVLLRDDQATDLTLGLRRGAYSVALRNQAGYGGNGSQLTLRGYQQVGKIGLEGHLSLGNYRLLEGTWNDLATATLQGSLPLGKRFVLTTELQVLRNKYYARDTRLFAGLKYSL